MNKRSLTLTGAAIVAVAATAGAFAFLHEPTLDAPAVDAIAVLDANGKRIGDYRIPADNTIAAEPNADAIRLGQRLLLFLAMSGPSCGMRDLSLWHDAVSSVGRWSCHCAQA